MAAWAKIDRSYHYANIHQGAGSINVSSTNSGLESINGKIKLLGKNKSTQYKNKNKSNRRTNRKEIEMKMN